MDYQKEMEIARKAVQLYAEQHPRPPHVTQKQAGEMLELSQPSIRKLMKRGVLAVNESGLIPIGMIDDALAVVGEKKSKVSNEKDVHLSAAGQST